MKSMTLWSALCSLPGPAAVESEWRMLTGDDFDTARRFLRPGREYAQSVPCKSIPPCRCRHGIEEYSDGRLEAVCRCEFADCAPFEVSREETLILELDTHLLCEKVAKAMALEIVTSPLHGDSHAYHIGNHRPNSTQKFPVYLITLGAKAGLEKVILEVLCGCSVPPIILYPADRPFSTQCRMALEHARAMFLPMEDVLSADAKGFTVTDLFTRSLARFDDEHVLVSDPKELRCIFPTPTGTRWCDVHIHFKYTDQVVITAPGKTREFTCHELGMGNSRTKKPKAIWDFMYEVAGNNGALDYSIGNKYKNKDWKHQITKQLRRIFDMEDDPFLYDEELTTWQAKLRMSR